MVPRMSFRATLITLGVRDLARARAFYIDGMGLVPAADSNANVVFFDMGGIVLSLYGRDALADDATLPSEGGGFTGSALAYNAPSREAVVATLHRAHAAGGNVVKEAQEVFWGGFSGYFTDPDGHLWEVAHNPFWPLDERGAVVLATG